MVMNIWVLRLVFIPAVLKLGWLMVLFISLASRSILAINPLTISKIRVGDNLHMVFGEHLAAEMLVKLQHCRINLLSRIGLF